MANIFKTSIGKKLIMSISGLFLIFFLCIHASVNLLYLFGDEWFQAGCDFMSLHIVTIIVPVLAAGFIVHIIWAFILYYQNYKARGKERYAVATKTKTEDWASRNMIVLGLLVLIGIALHLTDFWVNMQYKEVVLGEEAAKGPELMRQTFSCIWVYVLYVVWFIVLWFHLTHGFWSAFHTIGWSNEKWIKRLKVIGIIFVTILVVIFIAVATKGYLDAHCCNIAAACGA